MLERIPQSVAVTVLFKAYLSSDHVTAATGKTIAVVISKNKAAFANPNAGATNATEIANGWYYVDLATTDAGTVGPLIVRGTAATIDDVEIAMRVVDPHNAGFDGVPAVIAAGAGGLFTRGSGAGQINQTNNGEIDCNVTHVNNVATSSVTAVNANQGTTQPINFTGAAGAALIKSDMVDIAGSAVAVGTAQLGVNVVNFGGSAGTFSAGRPEVNTTHIKGTASPATAGYVGIDWAFINAPSTVQNLSGTTISAVSGSVGSVPDSPGIGTLLGRLTAARAAMLDSLTIRTGTAQAGGATSITLDAGASATDNLYRKQWIVITGGTGAGQTNLVTGYVGATKVATVHSAWAVNPDATSVFYLVTAADIYGLVLADTVTTTGTTTNVTNGVTVTAGGITNVSFGAGAIDSATMSTALKQALADTLLGRAQVGGSNTAPTVSQALAGGLMLFNIAAGTVTVLNGDGSTAYTRTLSRAVLDAIIASV